MRSNTSTIPPAAASSSKAALCLATMAVRACGVSVSAIFFITGSVTSYNSTPSAAAAAIIAVCLAEAVLLPLSTKSCFTMPQFTASSTDRIPSTKKACCSVRYFFCFSSAAALTIGLLTLLSSFIRPLPPVL